MRQQSTCEPPNDAESNGERKLWAMMENGGQRGAYSKFYSLPGNLLHIVAGYVSDDKRDCSRLDLLGKPYITLCLSQHAGLEFDSCWNFGCLSPDDDQLGSSMEVRVYMKYLIKDYQICVDFLNRENLSYRPFAIEILVVQLDMSSQDFSSALDDLQNALIMLQKHLKSLQHVVLAIEKHSFCCFSFNNAINNANGRRQAVDRPFALKQILDDLRTCWESQRKMSTMTLLDFYILQNGKPVSEMYFSKFVISLSHCRNRDLLDAVDPALKSSKLKWLYNLETVDEAKNFDQKILSLCHTFHLDTSEIDEWNSPSNSLPPTYCLEDNCFIERIVIRSNFYGRPIQLPRPSAPLTDATPRSALIELTLKGNNNTFDLTQLNNDYFPNLTHLSIVGGKMTGRLDSHHLPRLKTLGIELGSEDDRSRSKVDPLVRELTQSLIKSGRLWQIVTSQDYDGWSLASYDESTANPQNDEKHDAPPSPPIIRELMLVMETQENAVEWLSQLNGDLPLEAAADDENDGLLVWAPDRVEKITAFCSSNSAPQLEFNVEIHSHTCLLTSLTCHKFTVVLDGDALPKLQSLGVNGGSVKLSGTFSHLKTLSFRGTIFQPRWLTNAPLLESLLCDRIIFGSNLSLNPLLLPHLSFLKITPWGGESVHFPKILFDENSLGLSHVKHIVFEKGIPPSPFIDKCQVQKVSHLELTVDPLQLPAYWSNTEWLCETLTMNAHMLEFEDEDSMDAPDMVVLPPLPQVKKLTVTEKHCQVLLDSEMPELIDCTVPSPKSLGPNLKCPELKWICFTGKLSKGDKEKYSNPATYSAIGAKPRWVYFDDG